MTEDRRTDTELRRVTGEKLHHGALVFAEVANLLTPARIFWTLFVTALTYLGGSVVWPQKRFEALETRQREDKVQVLSEIQAVKNRQSALEEIVRLSVYVQCVQLRRSDPAAVPAECNAAILRGSP